jgi:hypothetical protein
MNAGLFQVGLNVDAGEGDRVTEGNEQMGLLGGLYTGDLGYSQYVALSDQAFADEPGGIRLELYPSFSDCGPIDHWFSAYIDHSGAARLLIDVRQLFSILPA